MRGLLDLPPILINLPFLLEMRGDLIVRVLADEEWEAPEEQQEQDDHLAVDHCRVIGWMRECVVLTLHLQRPRKSNP